MIVYEFLRIGYCDQNGNCGVILSIANVLVHLISGITTFGGFGGHMMLLGHPFSHGSSSTSGSLLYQYYQHYLSDQLTLAIQRCL